ncbi:hypothetical protein HYFRA_00008139 [Hymenoscyphus fraxineus]|uniref:Major facilitator superfamily (MFS) profile domain-containing protein n=1 Tax=Hymenoscyphus fraxineus TaxID=746836 RepID=A0A9N9L8E9_9HELO|nr:hypothetical protein HYFRA_00008139 [Hymenoscyphus fraxineus]
MALEKLKSSSSRPSGEVGKVGEEIIQNGYEEGSWKEKEKKLARKIDRNIIPLTMLLYMFSFLDRVNIGNAKLYGLQQDLGLVGNQYQIAVSILFVTYCLSEVPANLMFKKATPRVYFLVISLAWGGIATVTGAVQNFAGLVAVRLLMGLFEGGLIPALVTYLTLFYTRKQLALRVGYLLSTSAFAGAVGGMLSYAIGYMEGVAGLRAWRWLMIIEGLPGIFLGVAAYFVFPNSPDVAKFLSAEERAFLVEAKMREVGQTTSGQEFHWKDVKEGVRDWQIWLLGFCQFCNDLMLYGFSTFLPSIIKGTGTWTSLQAQALTVPVYAAGTIVFLVIAYISDRQHRRGPYASIFAMVSVAGFCMLIASTTSALSYAGCFVVVMGMYVTVGLPVAWLGGNKPRYSKRAFAIATQVTMGNIAGIVSPFLFQDRDAPRYTMGYGVIIGASTMAAGLFAGLSFYYKVVNRRRREGREDYKVAGMSEEEIAELGDRSPRYVYAL